jgi:YVTN family beta-propeller protein
MKLRALRSAALLVCALEFAACGSTTAGATSPNATTGPISPAALAKLPSAGTVIATLSGIGGAIPAGFGEGIAVDDTAVWVHNAEHATVVRVDPKTNQVVATIPVGHGPGNIRLEAGFVWVLNHDDGTVSKVDPQTNTVVATIALPPPLGFLGASPGAVWVANRRQGKVMKLDPQTNQVVATIAIADGPAWMTYAAGSLWVCSLEAEQYGVTRVDPKGNAIVAQVDVGSSQGYKCGGITTSDDGAIWAALQDSSQTYRLGLVRIDPATNKVVATVLLPKNNLYGTLAADAQGVWYVQPELGLIRVSPKTNQAVGFLKMSGAKGVAVWAGAVWAINSEGDLMRVTPAP